MQRIAPIARWSARLSSLFFIGVIGLFVLGEGLRPAELSMREGVLFVLFPLGVSAGMLLAWWRELPGAIVTLACLGLFYAVHLATSGHMPQGPCFLLFAVPGLFFLLSGCLSRRPRGDGRR